MSDHRTLGINQALDDLCARNSAYPNHVIVRAMLAVCIERLVRVQSHKALAEALYRWADDCATSGMP